MLWIGLTGGMGTGKSTVGKIISSLGVPVIDADIVAREVVEPGTAGHHQIVKKFGPSILDEQGQLDRAKVAQLVFSNTKNLSDLEAIIHPAVRDLVAHKRAELESQGHKLAVYEIPLLFEKKLEATFDTIIVVSTTPELQKKRVYERNQMSEEQYRLRLAAQLPLLEKIKKAHYHIENTKGLSELDEAVQKTLEKIKSQL